MPEIKPKEHKTKWYQDRVGIYLKPMTRNRLNVLKVTLAVDTGRVFHIDETVNYLIDHFYETRPDFISAESPVVKP